MLVSSSVYSSSSSAKKTSSSSSSSSSSSPHRRRCRGCHETSCVKTTADCFVGVVASDNAFAPADEPESTFARPVDAARRADMLADAPRKNFHVDDPDQVAFERDFVKTAKKKTKAPLWTTTTTTSTSSSSSSSSNPTKATDDALVDIQNYGPNHNNNNSTATLDLDKFLKATTTLGDAPHFKVVAPSKLHPRSKLKRKASQVLVTC